MTETTKEAKGDFWFRITDDSFDPKTGDVGVYLEIFAYETNPVAGFVPLKKARMIARTFKNAVAATEKAVAERREKTA
jgi:hypothetical protein